ncbi:hypothetical protein HHK36_015236 [Tetracentron sinense]|uniref:GTD-binding domain-containing protein n=1 Tax=Tetracentron sinense TaxID=13715 RepID=A0A834Z5S1_TETSI|nr:hypothetical protein HHK36_015236 [Tetracentron sinense]
MATRSFKQFIEQKLGRFPLFLIYAILEWVLIILLFLDGLLAFAANEFARFFELEIPCLLCTRIDHVLVHRNPDFYYNDSICEAHKKDVSSLAYCHLHQKLSDIRRMCEGCLLSFATENKSDCDTYKSLVGILDKDLECSVEDDHKIHLRLPAGEKNSLQVEKSSVHRCSCCGEPLRVRPSFPKGLVQTPAPNGNGVPQNPVPSPQRALMTVKTEESRSLDPLPHIQYTELRFMSDTESEIPEDDDGAHTLILDNQSREDAKAATMPLLTESDDLGEDAFKTPCFTKGNRFFGISYGDSPIASPRWPPRLSRRLLTERPESVTESLEVKAASEADDGAILHRLKRQVRLDRKSLIALYMELDEERSASAVAANNAMAMITRLQAEKAALQMEALQYQRMMEEQTEYDQEAVQVTKDMLRKRDEEIKVLEAEVEAHREKSKCGRVRETEECKAIAEGEYQKTTSHSNSSISGNSECGSPPNNLKEVENNGEHEHCSDRNGPSEEENGQGILDESLLDFEGERSYLLDRLRMLEKKIQLSSDDGVHSLQPSFDMVNHEVDRGDGSNTIITRELSHLSERLEAIETDREFLRHAALSLEKGGEGTKLLREIAQHLRELRHVEYIPSEGIVA